MTNSNKPQEMVIRSFFKNPAWKTLTLDEERGFSDAICGFSLETPLYSAGLKYISQQMNTDEKSRD